jgi:exonuclease III
LQNLKEGIILFLQPNYYNDIFLKSETHFTTKNYFRIPRYKLYYSNHPDGTAHGGTATLIKETTGHYELLQYEEESSQATSIQVNGFPYAITITAEYCPPQHNLKQDHFATFFQILGPKFIARGDYNSKHTLWGSRLITKGRELSKVIHENNYPFLSTRTPTYWTTDGNKIPDLLDFFVTNGISSIYTDIQSSYNLTSDHSPIIAKLSTSVIVRKPTPRLHHSQTGIPTDI